MKRKISLADWVGITGAHVLVLTPCIIFGVFVVQRLSVFLAIPLVCLLGVSLVSLNLVFLTEPGYIPLNVHPQHGQQQLTAQGGDSSEQLVTLSEALPEALPEEYPFVQVGHYGQDRVVIVDGRAVECKYCFTCQSMRPPRTYHCGTCDRCIYRHDHHCPWTGNCIGYRNYRFFFTFLVNTSVLTWFVFICTIVDFIKLLSDPQEVIVNSIGNHLESVLLIIYTFFMGISLGYLSGYHCYLVCKNLTTHEQIRGKYMNRFEVDQGGSGNPFDKGVWRNIGLLLWKSIEDQLVNFDFWAQESPKN
jgi:palmitoyltransferase ZDHHC9/14/18